MKNLSISIVIVLFVNAFQIFLATPATQYWKMLSSLFLSKNETITPFCVATQDSTVTCVWVAFIPGAEVTATVFDSNTNPVPYQQVEMLLSTQGVASYTCKTVTVKNAICTFAQPPPQIYSIVVTLNSVKLGYHNGQWRLLHYE